METWKPIKGFPAYFVSSLGRIYSEKQRNVFLKTFPDKCGYYHVKLRKDGKPHSKLVHRLVAEAFVENPSDYKEINHKDEDKSNNRADNLEWCTRKYNILYGKAGKERYVKMGLTQRYSRNDLKAVSCLDPKTGKVLYTFKSIAEAVREMFGVSGQTHIRGNISRCCLGHGHVKTVMGYKWRYADV